MVFLGEAEVAWQSLADCRWSDIPSFPDKILISLYTAKIFTHFPSVSVALVWVFNSRKKAELIILKCYMIEMYWNDTLNFS